MTFKYQPGTPPERDLRAWLYDELRKVSNAIGAAEFLQLQPLAAEPAKPSKAMLVWANGADWDPGAGEGLYVYNELGTWDKVN